MGLWKDKRNRKKEGKEVEEQETVKKKVGGKNKRGWGWGCIYEKSEGDIGVKGCVRGDRKGIYKRLPVAVHLPHGIYA